jgi:glycine/D-amino acid oxidase-like deaminating enzyme
MSSNEHGIADVVVVGGGSAGAVVAARLTQDPSRSVGGNQTHDSNYRARGSAASPEIVALRGKESAGVPRSTRG